MAGVERAPRVFISATSGDLKSLRLLVKDALLKIGCMPVEQADFPPDYRSVKDFLTSEIGKCDALLHFVGNRYGAEPDPKSLPTGEERRSYTQLEYEIARKMKKKVYTFICAEDFPFDEAPPEPEDKSLLQVAHRAKLLAQSEMRYRIDSAPACGERVMQLRLQLEDLAKQLDLQRRRQWIAWSSVAVTLGVILLVLLSVWRLSQDTQDLAKEAAGASKDLSKTTREIRDSTRGIQKGVEESALAQKQIVEVVSAVDAKIASLLDSDTLNQIAAKAEIDPLAVKQLVLQAQLLKIPVLEYAHNLAAESRFDESFGLARFIAETALLAEPVDLPSAVDALRLAADAKVEITRRKGGAFAEVRSQYESAQKLAERGIDLLRSSNASPSPQSSSRSAEIKLSRSRALYYQSFYVNADLARKSVEDAIAGISTIEVSANATQWLKLQLHLLRACLHTENSKYGTTQFAFSELKRALDEADALVQLADNHDDPQSKRSAYLARVNARLLLADLQPQVTAISTLTFLQQDCQEANRVPQEVDRRTQSDLAATQAAALLEMARLSVPETERERLLDDAMQKLPIAISLADDAANRPAAKIALRALVRASAMKKDREAMKTAFDQLMQRKMGFDRSRDLTYVFDYVDRFEPIEIVQTVVELLEKELADCPFAKMPRLHAELKLLQARLLIRSRKIARFRPEDGYTYPDLLRARKILESLFPLAEIKGEERSLASAYELYGTTSRWGDFGSGGEGIPYFEKALALLSRDQDPSRCIEIERQLK